MDITKQKYSDDGNNDEVLSKRRSARRHVLHDYSRIGRREAVPGAFRERGNSLASAPGLGSA